MKQISEALAAHLAGEVTTLASCWKLTRRDGVVMGFTDHDRDLVIEGITYIAASGFTASAIDSSAAPNVDNLDIEGMLSDGSIGDDDILAGKYDFAAIDLFQVNYHNLSQGIMKLRRGWLGEVSLKKNYFVAEVRGLTQRLTQTVGELFSASCRATLGDTRCKVNLASHSVTGEVTSGGEAYHEFFDSSRSEESGIFTFGTVTFTNGANQGLSMEVKEHIRSVSGAGQFILALPMPSPIGLGDSYHLSKGCDKTLATCHNRFNNVVNFRGEPHVPGLDRSVETAGTRSTW